MNKAGKLEFVRLQMLGVLVEIGGARYEILVVTAQSPLTPTHISGAKSSSLRLSDIVYDTKMSNG